MKKITGLVIILAVLILGGYYGMGVITERTLKNNLAIVNQSNGLYAEVVSYNRGWFESQALLNWSVHVPARLVRSANGQMESAPAQDYRIAMPLNIYHGPIIFADNGIQMGLGYAHTDLVLPSNLLQQFNAYFTKESTEPKMKVSLFVDYLNNSQIKIELPQFNLIAKQVKMTFDWLGMSSVVKATSSLGQINGNFAVQGVRFSQDKMVATLGKISGQYDLHKTDSGLFLGQASTLVPSVVVTNNAEKMFEMDEFAVDSSTNIEKDLFSASFKTSVDKLFINGRTYGPGHLELAVKNLDALVLANINAQINKAQQSTDLEKQQAMLAVLPELPKLFAQGAIFEITTMNLVVPEGKVEGDFTVSLPAGSLANPFELIQKIQGNGQLQLPVQLVKELVTQSLKQKLMSQSLAATTGEGTSVSGGVVAASEKTAPNTKPAATTTAITKMATANTASGTAAGGVNISTPPSLEDINQQAAAQTDEAINEMIQSGLLVQQGAEYLISIKLNQGQLVVNGKPFNAAMLKF